MTQKAKTNRKQIGNFIRKARKAKGLTIAAFADKIKMNRGYTGNMERGLNRVPPHRASKIARILGVKAKALLEQSKTAKHSA